jgi:hypothetical protein
MEDKTADLTGFDAIGVDVPCLIPATKLYIRLSGLFIGFTLIANSISF